MSAAPAISASRPFWACSRFSDCIQTRLRGPSITSSLISSPRCAGRQCMTEGVRAGGCAAAACRPRRPRTPRAGRRSRPPGPSRSTSRCRRRRRRRTASRGSLPTTTRPPLAAASRRPGRRSAGPGRSRRDGRGGPPCRTSPRPGRASGRRCCRRRRRPATRPSSRPKRSRSVSRSASAWHGCSRSVSALITGIDASAASCSTTSWAATRAMMPSTKRSRLWATSPTVSRSAEPDVAGGEVDAVAAELGHARLERDPRPQARVLEEHRQGPAAERRVGVDAGREVLRLELAARAKTRSTARLRSRSAKLTKSRPRSDGGRTRVGRDSRRRRAATGVEAGSGPSTLPGAGHPALGACRARRASRDLALGVLRRLAGPLEAVLLALLHPRVAGEEAGLAQRQADAPRDRAGAAPGRCRGGSRRPGRSRRRPRP